MFCEFIGFIVPVIGGVTFYFNECRWCGEFFVVVVVQLKLKNSKDMKCWFEKSQDIDTS